MNTQLRKRLFSGSRIAICILALGFVVHGVTYNDQVELRSGEVLKGTLNPIGEAQAAEVEIRMTGGLVRKVPLEDVAHDADGSPAITYGLRTSWDAGRKDLLALALCIQFPVGLLLGVRLRWMLSAQAIQLGYWDCVKLSFAGNFLNFATPLGSNAGDVFKAYFVSLHTERKTEAVTTIALDRVLGLGTLVVVVAVIASLAPSESRLAHFRTYTLTLLAIGALAAGVYFSRWFRGWIAARDWSSSAAMFVHAARIDAAARALGRQVFVISSCVLVTLALQGLAIGSYFVVAIAFGLDARAANALEYYAYFATGAVVQALPGPPQGLGTVELTYRYFFSRFGSASQILCVAFFVRLLVLLCALPGAWVMLTGAYRPRKEP